MSEDNNNAEVFVYMGGDEEVPNDIIRVQVHPSVTTIPMQAFKSCNKSLEMVELHDGVVEISERAFMGTNIKQIKIPDGIERIGESAFLWCTALSSIRMPPLLELPMGALEGCLNLYSVEISENVERIGDDFFTTCHKLRNVAIPLDVEIDGDIFSDLFSMLGGEGTDLYKQFGSEEGIVTGLKHRFDNLPIHKMIYYQSYTNVTADQLNNATAVRISSRRSKLDPSGKQQDCLGMTPLHILACSTVQNIELYKVLITKYPETLITEDRWGAVPLLYAIWGSAPDEIVQFLVESYQSIHPNYEFDWTDMVQTIYRHAHLDITQNLLDVKKEFFLDQRIGWEAIIEDATGMKNPNILSYLFKCSVAERLSAIGLKQWRDAMSNS